MIKLARHLSKKPGAVQVLVLTGTSLPTSTATTLALITWGAGLCLVLLPWPSAPPSCAPGS
jgi:hypothetical protein